MSLYCTLLTSLGLCLEMVFVCIVYCPFDVVIHLLRFGIVEIVESLLFK
jgi:hypothetical protein